MSDIHDATPGDIYVDENGKLWRVISVCQEPTVDLIEIEPENCDRTRLRLSGGISGLMWKGFKRIWQKDAP